MPLSYDAQPLTAEERLAFLDAILGNQGRIGDAGFELHIDSDRFWTTVITDEGFARAVSVALLAAAAPAGEEIPGAEYGA